MIGSAATRLGIGWSKHVLGKQAAETLVKPYPEAPGPETNDLVCWVHIRSPLLRRRCGEGMNIVAASALQPRFIRVLPMELLLHEL